MTLRFISLTVPRLMTTVMFLWPEVSGTDTLSLGPTLMPISLRAAPTLSAVVHLLCVLPATFAVIFQAWSTSICWCA